MNELEVKTIKLEPAVVEFNHKEIETELTENLARYKGMVFDEDSTTDLRSTLAYLRKGSKAVDDYRKETKKKLTVSVNKFEDKCKDLTGQFHDVINPLNEQLDVFVEEERRIKTNQVEAIRTELIEQHELGAEYHEQVTIESVYLNKSTPIKQTRDSIEFQIKNLKFEQAKLVADKETISMTIKLVNAENKLSFSEDAYVRFLEFDGVDQVKEQIDKDVKKALEKIAADKRKEEQRLERERTKAIEDERIEKERLKRIAEQEKQPVIEQEKAEADTPIEIEDVPFLDPVDMEIPDMPSFSVDMFPDIPLEEIEIEDETFVANWEVKGTMSQITKLERFMIDSGIEWSVK